MRHVVGILRPSISVKASGVMVMSAEASSSVVAVGRDPFAGAVMLAVGLAHPVQHQLVAGVEMQREPVPSGLVGGQRLAAPFAIDPGLPGDLDRLVVDGEAALRRVMRLAVIIGGLLAQRFAAVAAVALQHQRALGVETQRVAEIGARCFQFAAARCCRRSPDRARASPRHRSRRETALRRRRPGRRRRAQTSRLKRWVSARVTAAWPIQICWLAQPSCGPPAAIAWRNSVHCAP